MAQPAAVLSVLVTANTKPAQAQLAKFNKQLGATQATSTGAVGGMSKVAKGAGLLGVAVGGAGIIAAKAFGEFRESQKVMKQTNAVLKSTHDAAKVTADEVENLADAISLKAGMDDEAIQKAENLLLTFTKVRNETGKGNKIFNEATKVVTDMSVALDQDLKSSAIQVGKALQDPEKGITALKRVGVNFTETQREMITKWLEHGKVLKAQKFILAELNTEFKGSAEAQADGADKVAVAWNQLFEDLGKVIGPTIDKALTSLAKFLNQIRSGTGAGGEFAATMKDVARILKTGYEILSKYWFPVLAKIADLWWKAFKAEVSALNWLINRLKDVLTWLSKVGSAIAAAFVSTFNRVKKVVGDVMATIFRHFAKLFDLASHLPGIGGKFGDLRDKANAFAERVDKAGEKTKTLGYEIKKLPKSKRINIKVDASVGTIKYGGFNPLTGQPQGAPPAGGPGSILDQIGGTVAGKVDGKKLMAQAGAPGSAPGKLGMLEGLGHRMGLYTSSGYRPGDPGFHGQNRARDMAGSPANMLAYAKMLYNTYGTTIDELIHTPLGVGIDAHRAGQLSSLYPASTLADHYDHVHVAMARGGRTQQKVRALVGEEGPEIVDLPVGAFVHTASKSKAMMRDRIAAFASGGTVARAAQAAGFRGNDLVRAVAEAKGESGWNERAVGDGGWSKGLMQIYTKVHTWARNLNLFDPLTNMKAAKKIWDSQGWGAWHANHVPHIAAAKAAVASLKGQGGAGGGGTQEDEADFDWVKMGNHRRGVFVRGKAKRLLVDAYNFARLARTHQIDWRRSGHELGDKTALERYSKASVTKNKRPYGGLGKQGILEAFITFQSDRLNMATALAELTEDTADDIAVARDAVGTWGTWLNVAQLNNIPAAITTTATNLKQARDTLADLTAVEAPDTSAADAAASMRSGLLEQLLREANQRTAVSQAQYGALKYGGQFADGGVIPGPIGSPRVIVAHGGETVTPPGAGNVQVVVNGDIVNTPRGKKPVEIRDIRGSGRAPLPGGGGGWH